MFIFPMLNFMNSGSTFPDNPFPPKSSKLQPFITAYPNIALIR